jgi:hypothetical protein
MGVNYPEFDADFRSEGKFKEKTHRKKDDPKKLFPKNSKSLEKNCFMGLLFSDAFFLKYSL